MKRKIAIVFAALVIAVCGKTQTVITPKGTKVTIDTSKWTLSGGNIYNKNSGKVGIGTNVPAASALVDMSSTSLGILVPRMTTAQRTAIAAPANGLLVYDVTTNCFWVYKSSLWVQLISGAPTVSTKTASYTLTTSDNGSIIEFNSAAGVTITVPAGLPAGFQCSITQLGTGNVTVAGSGVTVKNAYNFTKSAAQYSKIGIEITSTGIAILSGDAQ